MSNQVVSVHIKGGLGNQLFQIAAAYAYAKKEGVHLQILHNLHPLQNNLNFDIRTYII